MFGGYFEGFLRNRLVPLYMLNALLVFFYLIIKLTLGISVKPTAIFQSFLLGQTIVEYGWYLQVCMLFYLIFMWSFRYTCNITTGMVIMTTLVSGCCILSYLGGLASTWFECSFSIIAGMFVRLKIECINKCTFSEKILFTLLVTGTFALTYVLGNGPFIDNDLWIVFKMLSSVCFAVMIFFISCFLQIKGRLPEWLGHHYLEIYVMQGASLLIAKNILSYDDECIYFLFVITVTIFLAAIVKFPLAIYMGLFKK